MEAQRTIKIYNMSGPFKMKYTNGKKADASAFPFANQSSGSIAPTAGAGDEKNIIAAKVDKEVKKKVSEVVNKNASINEVVNQEASEGLV